MCYVSWLLPVPIFRGILAFIFLYICLSVRPRCFSLASMSDDTVWPTWMLFWVPILRYDIACILPTFHVWPFTLFPSTSYSVASRQYYWLLKLGLFGICVFHTRSQFIRSTSVPLWTINERVLYSKAEDGPFGIQAPCFLRRSLCQLTHFFGTYTLISTSNALI